MPANQSLNREAGYRLYTAATDNALRIATSLFAPSA
jgi:hypothetical protein